MRLKYLATLFAFITLIACQNEERSSKVAKDSPVVKAPVSPIDEEVEKPKDSPGKSYSNERFRDVVVTSLGQDSFRVKGKAQIFEASFSWVIEDGHNEIKKGFSTADEGAPEWGNFDFVITAKKERENSTLHLVLFELSMKDGSRVHELAIPLQ